MKKLFILLEERFSLNPWGLFEAALESSSFAYKGKVELVWAGENSSNCPASLTLKASTEGSSCDREGWATLDWVTSSGHTVDFFFCLKGSGKWQFEDAVLGDDDSEYFYSAIQEIIQAVEA